MDKKVLKYIFIILSILISGFGYYQLTGNTISEKQTITITVNSVIDGDTIKDQNGQSYRMLGINTPEKNQPFYQEAKDFLKQIEGKQVQVELKGKDKYSRWLGYVFYNNELINKKQLEKGFANLYYYDKDNYYNEMKKAQEDAMKDQVVLWKKSINSNCIKLLSLEYKDGGDCKYQEQLILNNLCNNLSIIIKDDANHIYNENLTNGIFTKNFSCIWNDAGDTVFIRDKEGFILSYSY